MSTTIDERIVSMQFDNKHFESNVQESLSTLDKLKKSLNMSGASKGLENIESAARKVDFSSISNSAEKVGLKFSAMYTMADQALRNITNSAMAAGERIVKSLTIDPVKMGFEEYQTQINAVQTILANTKSKGTSLDDVNGALDELNTYADKTIYNFTEMTRNIGTFTAAGVDLDTSVSAIKGIANLAAVSGSNSQQASTAMYQLSQAMASGTVKLMDWNSVVNAGMGGQVFQDALKETAKVHGIAIDDIIKKQGSFRESLSEGWLTTEILTETLSKFTGDLSAEQLKSMGYTDEQIKGIIELGQTANSAATDVKTFTQLLDTLKESAQSGWSQTWEIVFGDFEEAKELFSKVSEVLGGIIGDSAEARNSMLEDWKTLGGRDDLIASIANAFNALMSVIEPIKEAFREIFPPMTGERLAALTKSLREFTEKLQLTDTASENLKRTFKGVFAVFSIIGKVISAVAKAIWKVLGVTDELGGGILSVTAVIGDWLVALNDAIENSGILTAIMDIAARAIAAVLGVFAKLIKAFQKSVVFQAISAAVTYLINVLTGAGDAMDQLSGKMAEVKAAWEASGLYKFLSSLWKIAKTVFTALTELVGGFVHSIAEAFGSGDFEKGFDIINGALSGGLLVGLIGLIKKIGGIFTSGESFINNINNMFIELKEGITGFANDVDSSTSTIKNLGIAIGILAASLLILSFVDPQKLGNALVALGAAFGEMLIAIKMVNNMALKNPKSMVKTQMAIKSMISMSIALLILSVAVKKIGELEWEEWARGIGGVTLVLLALAGAQWIMNQTSSDRKVKKAAASMVVLCLALKLIAASVKTFAGMEFGSMMQGILGMTLILAALTGAMVILTRYAKNPAVKSTNTKVFTKIGASLLILALAIQMLTPTLVILGLLPIKTLLQGIASIVLLLSAMAGVQIVLSRFGGAAPKMVQGAASLAIIAGTLKLIIPMFLILSLLPWKKALQGVVNISLLLGALAGVQILLTYFGGTGAKMTKASVALMGMSKALLVLMPVLLMLSVMSLSKVLQSVGALVIILSTLATALIVISKFAGSAAKVTAASSAMLILAGAMALLVPALIALSLLGIAGVAVAIISLAAAFTVLGVAALLLRPFVGVITALATSLLMISVACAIFASTLTIIGIGFSVIAVGLTTLVGALVALSGTIDIVVEVIIDLIVGVIEGIGRGIVALFEVLIGAVDVIFEFIMTILLGICDVIIEGAPAIVHAIFVVIGTLLEYLVQFTPTIVSALCDIIIGILNALAEKLPDIIKAAVQVLFAFITGVIEAFGGMDPGPLLDCLHNIGIITLIMTALAAMSLLAPAAMVGVIAMGVVVTELSAVLAYLGTLSKIPGLMWLVEQGGNYLQAIGTAIGKFIGGIVGGIASGISSSFPKIGAALSAFMENIQPFLDGAKSITPETLTGVKSLVDILYTLTKASLLDALTSWITGGSSLAKFGEELASFGINMRAYADSVAGIDASAVEASVNAAKMLSDLAHNLPNDGGVVGFFTGNNNIGDFGNSLVSFGEGMRSYAESVAGIDTEAVTASANAGKTLSELANSLPNSGGMVSWFAGDNDIGEFGTSLTLFGMGMKGFSNAVTGIDTEAVKASAAAAMELVKMTAAVPNEGGVVAWFTGENSISKYGLQLVALGLGIAGFSKATAGIDTEALAATSIAAAKLAEMTNMIPNEGGVRAWFSGESSISKFGNELTSLGTGLKGFADKTIGINPESLTATANAAKVLAEMTQYIPNEGGALAWFSGESSISKFAGELSSLGIGLNNFATQTAGIKPESVTAAAAAAKDLAEMTKAVPSEGGMTAWISGERSVSKFAGDLSALGKGLSDFNTQTTGINPDTMTAAANAAKALAEMTNAVPTEGGAKAWWEGEKSVSKFAGELSKLGEGLTGFSKSTEGVNPEKITAAANAAKALAEMTKSIPEEKGIKAWFGGGDNSISKFADKLPGLGEGLKGFSDSVEGINPENLTAASNAAKAIAEMCKTSLPNVDKIPDLATNIKTLGGAMKACFADMGGITAESITAANNAVKTVSDMNNVSGANIGNVAKSIHEVVDAIKSLSTVPANAATNFNSAMSSMGKTSAKALLDAFKNIKDDMTTAGENAINAFITGANNKKSAAEKACEAIISACKTAISGGKDKFTSAGEDLVSGFASGITSSTWKAEAKAAAMAKAAAQAAEEALDINSPSKVFRAIGYSVPEGFAMGIDKLSSMATESSTLMAKDSVENVRGAVSKLADVINSDIDAQPTIRPVLDLSDVRSGANSINSLFGSRTSVGVLARVNGISASMRGYNQNGDNSAIVDGIDKLNKQLKGMDNATYNINGVTFSGDSEVEEAFATILRAAKIERRR